jgi:uncharacterized metal-binding protein
MARELKDLVVSATLKAINKAQERYFDMTGNGVWLWEAPEYFLTVKIAEAIFDACDKKTLVSLEEQVKGALYEANAIGKGKMPKAVHSNGKADIVLYALDGKPFALVEVKNKITSYVTYKKSRIQKDVKRIGEILKRNADSSSIDFGLVAFYICDANGAISKIDKKIAIFLEKAKEDIASINSAFNITERRGEIIGDDNDAYCGVIFEISR